MKILITGGLGFFGSNLTARAISFGYKACVIDNMTRVGSHENYKWLNSIGQFEFHKTSITDVYQIDEIVKNFVPDVIFHMAGQVSMISSIKNPIDDFSTNALGTIVLLESVKKYSPSCKFIFASTNKVYGDLDWVVLEESEKRYRAIEFPNGFNESIPLDFRSPYGCSKGAADQYVLDYSRIYGLNTSVFRHSSIYGMRQHAREDQGWIGWFCSKGLEAHKNQNAFTISGNGKQVRDILFVTDAVDLYFKSIEKFEKICGKAFNIGGGINNSVSILELLEIISKKLGVKYKLNYKFIEERSSDQKVFISDNIQISESIGWHPKISYLEGIEKMLTDMKE
jgi:CDP-paratose 2-epimerase